ncbi:hypothetical protein QN277_010481 [Acacia crassicarpa]|uniref:Uncharacterized protein n=2 Tax=Acacia crassicarpa TaxID=499986 RepID=A0AAE1IQY4_9FABA|nr:hypothetical protein QN277_010481 [Acacia crassicarpa]
MSIRNHHDVASEITAMFDKAEPPMYAQCCIYRVPYDIRKLNEDTFTPKVVSIGPFHYGHPRLQNMEKYKLLYAKCFSERVSRFISLDGLINLVEEVEPSVRRCYSDTVELSSKDFVKVILLDSCFLFELFLRSYYGVWSQNDAIHLKPWLGSTVIIDLFLLENQLPFFILERLFNIAFPSTMTDHKPPSFLELAFHYFAYYNSLNLTPQDVSISHFTDLIRTFHLQPLVKRPTRGCETLEYLQSAIELTDAGVRFRKSSSPCLLDIKFLGRVLEIPQLRVEDTTETLLCNLVALEQCHYPSDSYIIDYVAVMDYLINTSKDVDVLVQNGVILNWLGETESVANLFNNILKNVTHVRFNSHYSELCENLDRFCKSPWHNMKATLRRDYFNTPWQTAGSIVGVLLLVLSLTETVCSILQVLQQPKQ